jgi:hypothetical protein
LHSLADEPTIIFMPLDHLPLKSITIDHIRSLIEYGEVENRKIEYKQDYRSGVASGEVCFDISAFANGIGGDILYGVPELEENGQKTGKPESAKGMKNVTLEMVRQQIEPLLSSRVQPRLPAIEFHPVQGDDGPIVIVRVPKSWRGPHIVRVGEGNQNFRCYVRNGGGNGDPLDVQQLRDAFLMSSSIPERVRSFRKERITGILSRDMPIRVVDESLLVTHIVPITAMNGSAVLNWNREVLEELPYPPTYDRHVISFRRKARFNLNGFVFCASEEAVAEEVKQLVLRDRSYVQFYRSGSIEVVNALAASRGDYLPSLLGSETANHVRELFQKLAAFDVQPPAYVMITLLRVSGRRLWVNGKPPESILGQMQQIDEDNLYLPEILIEDSGGDMAEKLRDALDALWQAGGYSSYFESK